MDNCLCEHSERWHDIETGVCEGTRPRGTERAPCTCRRYRRRWDVDKARREERFWAGVGRDS